MTFTIYLDKESAHQFERIAKESGKKRNALIREALKEWLARRKRSQWPSEIINFKGIKGAPRFEDGRKLLKPPREPFDELSS
jgi:Ribbon-helix-helix protein, copG family